MENEKQTFTRWEFTDFAPKDLIGKYVLYHFGTTYGSQGQAISRIASATKGSFKIDKLGCTDYQFNISDGRRRGLSNRMSWSTVSYCELITVEEAAYISANWREARELKELKTKIVDELSKDNSDITKGQLLLIGKIIFNQNKKQS